MEWRNSYGRKILCRIRQCISSNIESNRMACAECVAVGPKCGKGLSSAVRTCRKSISCLCKSRNTIGKGVKYVEDLF